MNLPKELITNVNKYMYTNIETSKLQRTMRLKLFCFSHDLNYYKLTRSSFEDKYEGQRKKLTLIAHYVKKNIGVSE